MQNKFQNPELTAEQQNLYNTIIALQSLIESATLNTAEMSQYTDMTYAKKKKLVSEIYFKDKKRKEFYACKDGRYKSYNPQFIAPSEKELVQKLYDYYFNNTLEDIYKQWVQHRAETQIVSQKTIELGHRNLEPIHCRYRISKNANCRDQTSTCNEIISNLDRKRKDYQKGL